METSGNPLATPAPRSGADVLNEGFQAAFVACAVLAGIGVALAMLLLRPPA